MAETVRVAIAVESDIGRLGLEQIVLQAPGYEVVACGPDVRTVLDAPPADVAIVGLGPDISGAELSAIVAACARVLCFGRPARRAEAVQAGVTGFLSGTRNAEELIELLEVIAAGGTHLPDELFPPNLLSPRECEVLGCVAAGCTDREIGERLGISMRTAQSHLDRIREKTGRRRRAELTALAYDLGLARVC